MIGIPANVCTKCFYRIIPGKITKYIDSLEQLEELGERFLEAESLDEIQAWAEEKRLTKAQ